MNDPLELLSRLVMPPKAPLYNQGNWELAERELGTCLPREYKDLIDVFGQGTFVGEAFYSGLLITSYLAGKRVERAKGVSEYFQSIATLPYHVYPQQPGLLGFASYGDRDTIAWNTTGSPDNWTIVWHDPQTDFHEIRDMGLLALIVSVLEESSPLHRKGVIRKGHMKGPHTFCPEP